MRSHPLRLRPHRPSTRPGRIAVTALALVCTTVLAGCAGQSSSGGSAAAGADVKAAAAAIKPYHDAATPFPADVPLNKPANKNLTFAQLQFGTPVGALIGQIIEGGAKAAGVSLKTVKAGATSSATQAGIQSLGAGKPNFVLIPASEPSLFSQQLSDLESSGSKVISTGVMDPGKFGITAGIFDRRMSTLVGKLMADYVVAKQGGKAKAVFYETPELSFSAIERDAFKAELSKLCPSCTVRLHTISATTVGTTAPNDVTSDLQANPSTTVAVFATSDADNGVPPALKVAGITTPIVTFGPDPVTLQYVKDGSVATTIAFDVAATEWATFDMAFRLDQGMPLTPTEKAGVAPIRLIDKANVPADISHGYSAYPDFASRYLNLWKGKG